MIKFFRHIRQSLLSEGKTARYFKYAFGEILLVVIGILIALQINTWNEEKNQSKKELKLLQNLRRDINETVSVMKRQDSAFARYEANTEKGLALFYSAQTVKDIDSVMRLCYTLWNDLFINRNTYDEMVNSGSMYNLNNEGLQKEITSYYVFVDAHEHYIESVNATQNQLRNLSENLHPLEMLLSELRNSNMNVGLKHIDTTWITNKKSKTYMALHHYLNQSQLSNNIYRRDVFQRIITRSEQLGKAIDDEID